MLKSGVELNITEEEIDTAALDKRWLYTRKVPILDDKGQQIYLLGISEDIIEAKLAEEEIRRPRLLPNKTIETTVSDNGPGIDADMDGRMFSPFQNSKSSGMGMGMGLSISRPIVEAHGGKLWADVQRRDGALFGFNLHVCE